MAASEQQQTWKLHGPVSDSDAFASSPTENPLDWTCEELKGRATALFFQLSDGEILVREGDVVVIVEQTLAGDYFVILNKRTGQSGKVPVDYIEINRSTSQSSTFPRLSKPVTTTAPSSAQSLTVAPSTKEYRSATSLPDVGETGDVRRDSRSATVAMATEGGASAQDPGDDDVVEYEEGFKMVEKYNIISVSGSDRDGRPVIVISACRLPPSYAINHDVLLRYGKYFLDKIVEQDYTLLYCHYGLRSHNKPSFSWLRKVYAEMDRKYKKNIKKVYVLHPTNFIRVMLSLMKPFLNYKFGRKLSYVNRLAELEQVLYLDKLKN